MPPFVIAIFILIAGLWLFKYTPRLNKSWMQKFLPQLAAGLVILIAIVLALRGSPQASGGLFMVGLGLFRFANSPKKFFGQGAQASDPRAPSSASQKRWEWRSSGPGQRHPTLMTESEALAVLGLKAGASSEEVRAAHRRLIMQFHPDKGGSDHLAAQINTAKSVLLAD